MLAFFRQHWRRGVPRQTGFAQNINRIAPLPAPRLPPVSCLSLEAIHSRQTVEQQQQQQF